MNTRRLALLAAALLPLALPSALRAADNPMTTSGYPPANASWLTTPVGQPVSVASAAAPATITMPTNGLGTVRFDITGTGATIVGKFECTPENQPTQTWKTMSVYPVAGGGGAISNITANGTYVGNAAACAQVRFNLASMASGTLTLAVGGGPAAIFETVSHERRPTYSAAWAALTPAASATDFATICGNATTTVRVTRVQLGGTSTAASTDVVTALVRSTADTTGTSTTPPAVPHDANDPAASSAVKIYTVNPGALGTSVGRIRSSLMSTNTLAAPAFSDAGNLILTFGDRWNEEVVLRGTAQCLALNNEGASFTAGTSLIGSFEWTEE